MATLQHTTVLEEVVGECGEAGPLGAAWTLTFVLRGEALHGQRQGLVEPLFLGDEGLAHRVLIILHHAQVTPDLVQEGLQCTPGASTLSCTTMLQRGVAGWLLPSTSKRAAGSGAEVAASDRWAVIVLNPLLSAFPCG